MKIAVKILVFSVVKTEAIASITHIFANLGIYVKIKVTMGSNVVSIPIIIIKC